MQTEGRLRGEPAARSEAEEAGRKTFRSAPGAESQAPRRSRRHKRRTLAADGRRGGVRAGLGASRRRALRPEQVCKRGQIKTRDPCAASAASVRSLDPRVLSGALRGVPARRGPARPVRDSTVGEGFPPQTVWDEDGNSTIRTLEARCEGFRLWLEIKCPGGMQSRDHRGIRAPCSRSWRKNRGARGPRHGIAADWPRRTPSSDAIPILAVASVLPGERLQR